MALNWSDKKDDVDFVLAEDINDIARAVIEQEKEASAIHTELEKKLGNRYTRIDGDGEPVEGELTAQQIYDNGLLDFYTGDTGMPISGFKVNEFHIIGSNGTGVDKARIEYLDGNTVAAALGERAVFEVEDAKDGKITKARLSRLEDSEGISNPSMSVYSAEVVNELSEAFNEFTNMSLERIDTKADAQKDTGAKVIYSDDKASANVLGLVKTQHEHGLALKTDGTIVTSPADDVDMSNGIEKGTQTARSTYRPITPFNFLRAFDTAQRVRGIGVKSIAVGIGERYELERGCIYFAVTNDSNAKVYLYDRQGNKKEDAGGDEMPGAKWAMFIISDNETDVVNKRGYDNMAFMPSGISATSRSFLCFSDDPSVFIKSTSGSARMTVYKIKV